MKFCPYCQSEMVAKNSYWLCEECTYTEKRTQDEINQEKADLLV